LAQATRGVFVNIALQEPFGLTVIEAAAHGVPTVATKNGGPVDIMATLHHGVVVDPTDADAVAGALLRILTQPQTWDDMSAAGVRNIMVRVCLVG
jgi:sucrose-phosphate synthase